MKKISFTHDELIELLATSGLEIYESEILEDMPDEYILVDYITSEKVFNLVNVEKSYLTTMQIKFITNLSSNKLRLDNFMKTHFTPSVSFPSYEDEFGSYITVYQIRIYLSEV